MNKYDLIRITAVDNGYIISARPMGQTPAHYAYRDKYIAKTADEVLNKLRELLHE